ncbi:MAG: phosphatidylserine decarboxylase [Alphaproteobacteria bacterium]|jgi:phosphatidylserine decarboxylase|nr:phosphatidylserine decarboxylase [Alphaproteobacteria bacterium]
MKIKDSLPPIHQEGYIFIICALAFSLLVGAVSSTIAWFFILITIFIVCFFRNPNRIAPNGSNLVISPADGTIDRIEEAHAPEELGEQKNSYKRISIFLSVFNVHVNRNPVSGTVTALHYRKGAFLNAAHDKASEKNERQTCVVKTEQGDEIIFVQIAGLIARRIVCYLNENQTVNAGDEFGIIRFGSRMDVYLPKNAEINVSKGQTMIGGETILAKLKKKPAPKK